MNPYIATIRFDEINWWPDTWFQLPDGTLVVPEDFAPYCRVPGHPIFSSRDRRVGTWRCYAEPSNN